MSEGSARIAARQKASAARKKASAAQQQWRDQQREALRRRQAWATEAAVAIGDRDDAIARCEQRAGIALAKLVEDGLGLEDAVLWTGGAVTIRQARALIAQVCGGGGDGLDAADGVEGGSDGDGPAAG